MKLGDVYVEVKGDTKKVRTDLGELKKTSDATSKSMTASWKKVAVAMVAVAAASAVAVKAVKNLKKLVDIASDLEEAYGKFGVVFSDQMNRARIWSRVLVDSYAMSTRESYQFLSSIQDLLVPMGMMADKAGEMSFAVVKLSADLGSFNNLPTAQVMGDIQSALVGNYETMKKYGVVLNATVVQEKALAMGLADTKDALTAAHKAQAAYVLIVEGSTAAIGDMERTSMNYANQVKRMMARVEDLAAKIGNVLLPKATEIVTTMANWVEKNDELIAQKVEVAIDKIAKAVTILAKGLKYLVIVAGVIAAVFAIKFIAAIGLTAAGVIGLTARIGASILRIRALAGVYIAWKAAIFTVRQNLRYLLTRFKGLSTFMKGVWLSSVAVVIESLVKLARRLKKTREEGFGVITLPVPPGREEPLTFPMPTLPAVDVIGKRILEDAPLIEEFWVDLIAFAKSFETELGLINYEMRMFQLQSEAAWEAYKEGAEEAKAVTKSMFDGMKAGIGDFMRDFEDLSALMKNVTYDALYSFSTGMSNAFMDFVLGVKSAKDAFRDFAVSFLDQVARMIIQMLILKAVSAGMGWFGFTPTPVPAAQHGGVFTGPKSGYPVMLHGTERVTPMSGPGAGGGPEINVNVNVEARGGVSKEEANEVGARIGKVVSLEVDRRLAHQLRPGGLLNRVQMRTT